MVAGSASAGSADGVAAAASFNAPAMIAMDAGGTIALVVSDDSAHCETVYLTADEFPHNASLHIPCRPTEVTNSFALSTYPRGQ